MVEIASVDFGQLEPAVRMLACEEGLAFRVAKRDNPKRERGSTSQAVAGRAKGEAARPRNRAA
jgi:hypothetical protein